MAVSGGIVGQPGNSLVDGCIYSGKPSEGVSRSIPGVGNNTVHCGAKRAVIVRTMTIKRTIATRRNDRLRRLYIITALLNMRSVRTPMHPCSFPLQLDSGGS